MSAETELWLIGWVHALGWALLHFLWQGALIGAAHALVRWLVGHARAQWRYLAGLIALALLALAPAVTLWQLAPASMAAAAPTALAGVISVSAVGDGAVAEAPTGIEPWLPWLVAAWLVGVLVMSMRTWHQYWYLRNLVRREAQPLPQWEARLRELVRRFRVSRPVRVVMSAIVQTPSLIGWITPVIVLPASVLAGLTPRQLELVIAHELGHIRRWDYFVNLLQIALESLLFYHPVVHWISREVRNEREACCDDLVLRLGADPVDYARTLASLEELRAVTHAPAVAATGGLLLGRIRRIVGAEPMFAAPSTGAQGVTLLALAIAAVLAVRPFAREALDREVGAEPASSGAAPTTPARTVTQAAAMMLDQAVALAPTPELRAPAPPMRESAPPTVADIDDSAPVAIDRAPLPARDLPAPARVSRSGVALADLAAVDAPRPLSLPAVAAKREPIARRTVPPVFPRRAMLHGTEGKVTLSFEIDSAGRAHDIRVIAATTPGEFEQAAITALRAWRFEPGRAEASARERYAQTFDFTLGGESTGQDEETCEYRLGSRICRKVGAETGLSRRDVAEGEQLKSFLIPEIR
jgi:TonB family protein